jgi:hypothetical protein
LSDISDPSWGTRTREPVDVFVVAFSISLS